MAEIERSIFGLWHPEQLCHKAGITFQEAGNKMSCIVTPIGPRSDFVAEINGMTLGATIRDEDFKIIREALDHYAVIAIRDQVKDGQIFDEIQQLSLARRLGPVDEAFVPAAARGSGKASYGDVSNVTPEGKIWDGDSRRRAFLLANQLWHSDTSYKRVPTWATLLTAHVVPPEDGGTQFSDMRAAWDDLPEERKTELEKLSLEHDIFYSRSSVGFNDFTADERAAQPPVQQPLVRRNPRSGRRSLYLSSHASQVVGMPEGEGRALIKELTDFATQPAYCYTHEWRVGDVVIWDNSSTMHRAMPFKEFEFPRVLKRTSVNELGPVVV
jgi:alpha-ketoglutarate-dependent 2,4-dichlorophenoxyacetate dioxygenase